MVYFSVPGLKYDMTLSHPRLQLTGFCTPKKLGGQKTYYYNFNSSNLKGQDQISVMEYFKQTKFLLQKVKNIDFKL